MCNLQYSSYFKMKQCVTVTDFIAIAVISNILCFQNNDPTLTSILGHVINTRVHVEHGVGKHHIQ